MKLRFLLSFFICTGVFLHRSIDAQSLRFTDQFGDTIDCASFPSELYSTTVTPHFFNEIVEYSALELRPLAFCDMDSITSAASSVAATGVAFPCAIEHSTYLGAGIENALLIHVRSSSSGTAFSGFIDIFASDSDLEKYNMLGVDSSCIDQISGSIESVILSKEPYLSQTISPFAQYLNFSSIDTTIEVTRDRIEMSFYVPARASVVLNLSNISSQISVSLGRFSLRSNRINAKLSESGNSVSLEFSSGAIGDSYNVKLNDLRSDSIRVAYTLYHTPAISEPCEIEVLNTTSLVLQDGSEITPIRLAQASQVFRIDSATSIFKAVNATGSLPDSILGYHTAFDLDDYYFLYSDSTSCEEIAEYIGGDVVSNSTYLGPAIRESCIELNISQELGVLKLEDPRLSNRGKLTLFDFSGREYLVVVEQGQFTMQRSKLAIFAGGFFHPDDSNSKRSTYPVCITYSE